MGGSATEPRATVVIAAYNRPEHARRAVRSALAQSLEDVEVVLVDDGSTPPIELDVADPRVVVVRREEAGGMCAARNHGLAVARGEWVTFLDDDDELVPEMLERSLAAAAASSLPAPVSVMSTMVAVTPEGEEIERYRPPTLPRGRHFVLEGTAGSTRAKNTLVMPTALVRSIGGWDPQFATFEADDFGIRLNLASSIHGLDEPLYRLTQHRAPRLTTRWSEIPRDLERTVVKHEAVFRQHRAAYAHYLSTIGMYDLKAGRWGLAVRWTLAGLVRNPRRARLWLFAAAALAGPRAVGLARRVRGRDAGVDAWTLTRRRARKWSRRLGDHLGAIGGVPLAWLTRRLARRATLTIRPRTALLVCVYRARNAAHVAALVDEADRRGWEVRLWALDEVAPSLAARTLGTGPGAKFPLLNDLLATGGHDGHDWVLVADDDFVLRTGTLDELLAISEAGGLDLVQPAHTEISHRSHAISTRRPLVLARRTTYVEIGPLFAVHRTVADRVLPFPPEHAMGWGLELDWVELGANGARLGLVDAVAVRHLHPVAKDYAADDEIRQMKARLRARGLSGLADVQRTLGIWRPWQARPPW